MKPGPARIGSTSEAALSPSPIPGSHVAVAYFFNGLPGQVFADRLASSSRPAKTSPNEALALRIGQLGRHKRRLIAQLVEEMMGDEGCPPRPQDAPGKAGPQTDG